MTKVTCLPDDFRADDPVAVRRIITKLKAQAPTDPHTAAAWYELFCQTSDAITAHQTALEIRAARNQGNAEIEAEIERFDSEVMGIILNQRESLMRVYLENSWRQAMHADDHGRLHRELERRLSTSNPQLTSFQLRENALIREYRSFVHGAQARFMERPTALSVVVGKMNDRSEAMRRMSYQSFWRFVADNRERYAQLFIDLSRLRREQALITGASSYESFVYDDMGRDFKPSDAARLRKNIAKYIVPLVSKLSHRQSQYLEKNRKSGVFPWNARIWQEGFPDSLPCEGVTDKYVAKFEQAIRSMHPVFGACFDAVTATDGFDVFPRAGKAPGAFCALRPDIGVPFVFGNFAVSTRDLFSLFHEFGHAVHGYCSAPIRNTLLRNPGLEYCEFVSTTFEFLGHEALQGFWEDPKQAKRASVFHLFHSLAFLPFAAQLDEWQSLAYGDDVSLDDLWAGLTATYRPHLRWDWQAKEGEPQAIKGLGWCSRPHVFTTPFYYIDYAIAQIGAWQIYAATLQGGPKREQALEAFVQTLFLGGQRSSLDLFAAAGCSSPFEEETIARVASDVEAIFQNL